MISLPLLLTSPVKLTEAQTEWKHATIPEIIVRRPVFWIVAKEYIPPKADVLPVEGRGSSTGIARAESL
jgi:hypothetical protein